MNFANAFILVAVIGFSGSTALASPSGPDINESLTSSAADSQQKRSDPAESPAELKQAAKPLRQLQTTADLTFVPAIDKQVPPNAVIELEPDSGSMTREMENRLQKLVDESGQDERTFFRVESYVPHGGSPSLDLVRAEKALRVIRDRLVAMGIALRRILLSSFGAEHKSERDSTRHWVEIYLVKTKPEASAGSSAVK